ncbi:DUF4184 family protein [Streptomyces capillispiralis]|uniref:Uncharacterized protein DUF4184 n=1 Tax=Streptomyces capillispiralis TaxID=68182 RepID=A0A561TMB7_9ACTN|nr:DUF4184 family protein [Streptomyces capillispiralis]TWF88231.1 uncharacterized protein DUF4184 [Streptomyces capillispiralis]GHH94853.1 hypothetical protein GCM10017779_53100 [Streptomyces capillispiralis]
MPFTLSHAAAVLPAVRADGSGRGPFVPAVLIAGSFAPDMTYYAASVLSGAMQFGDVTHAFWGVFTVDVAIAWALVGLWLLVREPLVALLPRARQGRAAALLRCGAPRARVRPSLLARWYVSAVLGSLTHVVWDAFTHLDQWGMRVFPVLGREIAGSPLYWYMQYGGSAVAAVVIALFVARALRRTAPRAEPAGVPLLSAGDRGWALALLAGCALVGAVQRASRWWAYWGSTAKPWELIPTVCFGAGAGLVLALPLYAVAVRAWRPASPASPATEGPEGAGGRRPSRTTAR